MSAIYRHSIRRNRPNRPHISSVIHQCQRTQAPKDPETKTNRRTLNSRCNPPIIASVCRLASQPIQNSIRPSRSIQPPNSTSAPPVRGVLGPTSNHRKHKIKKIQKKYKTPINQPVFNTLQEIHPPKSNQKNKHQKLTAQKITKQNPKHSDHRTICCGRPSWRHKNPLHLQVPRVGFTAALYIGPVGFGPACARKYLPDAPNSLGLPGQSTARRT